MPSLLLGEIHTSSISRDHIEATIRRVRPKVLLHELLVDDYCPDQATITQRLKTCRVGGVCDPRLNKDLYELGHELGIPLVGIDLPKGGSFRERETHMVAMINKWLTKTSLVAVVGDTHLRDNPIPRVGFRSLLRERFDNDPRIRIERAPYTLREVS